MTATEMIAINEEVNARFRIDRSIWLVTPEDISNACFTPEEALELMASIREAWQCGAVAVALTQPTPGAADPPPQRSPDTPAVGETP